MGITYTTIKIKNPLRPEVGPIELTAKVDTGATLLVIPKRVADMFEFPVVRKQTVKYANEEVAEREVVAPVEIEVCGRKGWFEAIAEPKKEYALLGAVVMESLDLIVEPRSLKIFPNPRSKLPMAEIE